MIKPIHNNYLIKPVISDNPLNLISFNGEPLTINPRFEPLRYTPQFGEIVEHPISNDGKEELIPIGTKIFFHYIVCEEYKKLIYDNKEYYLCPMDLVWGSVESFSWTKEKELFKIMPTNGVIICEKVIESETMDGNMIIRINEERIEQKLKPYGTIVFNGWFGAVGSNHTLLTVKGAGIPIPDSDLVFIKKVNVLAVEYKGEIATLKNKHLILEDELPDTTIWKGLMVADMHRCKFQTGVYIDGDMKLLKGRTVTFIHGMSTKLEINGVKYAVVENKDLIFLN